MSTESEFWRALARIRPSGTNGRDEYREQSFQFWWREFIQEEMQANVYGSGEIDLVGVFRLFSGEFQAEGQIVRIRMWQIEAGCASIGTVYDSEKENPILFLNIGEIIKSFMTSV